MKLVNRMLYSLAAVLAGVLFPKFNAMAASICGTFCTSGSYCNIQRSIFSGSHNWSCCSNNLGSGCNNSSIATGFDYACFTYDGVWGLNLYNCTASGYKCAYDKLYNSTTGCTACTLNTCANQSSNHTQTSCSMCKTNYYKSGNSCLPCPGSSASGILPDTLGQLSPICHTYDSTSCFLPTGSYTDSMGSFALTSNCPYVL